MHKNRHYLPRLQQLESRLALSATVVEHNDIGYFLQGGDPGLARYDIVGERWLDRVDLVGASGSPSAAHVDDDGIYVAFGTAVYRYNLDGTGQTHVINSQYNVQRLHTDGDVLFVNHSSGLYARVISIDKNDNTVIDTIDSYIDSIYGSSIAPGANRIFGRRSGISPSDITYVSYTDDGHFLSNGDSPYHGDYPGANQTWVFDDGSRVVDSAGTIYSTALQYVNSFPTGIWDIAFVGGEIPIVLFQNTVTAYSIGLLPTGEVNTSGPASDIFVNDQSVIAFWMDSSAPHGWSAEVIALSELSAPAPGEPLNPLNLPFTPDGSYVAADGTVLLFSKQHQSVFRFDPVGQTWGATIPLIESPLYIAYSAESNTIYLAYDSGLIRRIALDEDVLVEVPFATLPQRPFGLSTAGEYLFAADPSGNVTHYTFRPDGTAISQVGLNRVSTEYIWSEVNRKMYFFRDGISPNDLLSEEIREDGSIGNKQDSPLHSSAGFVHPIRVAPDGSVVVLGSGVIHDANTLVRLPQSLANPVSDIAWLGRVAYTIRSIAGVAQIQSWSAATWGQTGVMQLPGEPVSLTSVGDGRLLAVTIGVDDVPQLTVIDSDLNIVPRPTPVAVAGDDVHVDVGSAAMLDGSASFDPDNSSEGLAFQWSLISGPADGEFGSPASAATTFSADTAGDYEIQLTVSDGEYEASDTVLVTYQVNLPPVPDASSSETEGIAQRGPITLSSVGTTDPNGDSVSVVWSVVDAPEDAVWTLTSEILPTAQLASDTPGDYTVQLEATDGMLTGTATIVVSFAENNAPQANPSRSQTTAVAGRRMAILDARASTDPEGDTLSYFWEVITRPQGDAPSISNPTSASSNFVATVSGIYEVRLTVDDGLAQDSATFTITVAENLPPVADVSRSATEAPFGAGAVRLDGTASTDPDDPVLNYQWQVIASSNDTSPRISSSNQAIAFLNPEKPGVYAIELTVSDGASSDIAYVLVTIRGNQAPTADASSSDSVIIEGGHAWLDATRSFDPDGDPLTYSWMVLASTRGSTPSILDPAAPRTQLSLPEKGSYAVQLEVTDGVAVATDVIIVTVREALEQPLMGDFNGNSLVEQQDLDLVLSNWGRDSGELRSSWVGSPASGLIDQDELDAVLTNWGQGAAVAFAEPREAAFIERSEHDCITRTPGIPAARALEARKKVASTPKSPRALDDPLTVHVREESLARFHRHVFRDENTNETNSP